MKHSDNNVVTHTRNTHTLEVPSPHPTLQSPGWEKVVTNHEVHTICDN